MEPISIIHEDFFIVKKDIGKKIKGVIFQNYFHDFYYHVIFGVQNTIRLFKKEIKFKLTTSWQINNP